ncbi:hypothetical protein BFP72_13095 [Reichenbachiella sp. 5M10]|uniref:hypothetical protein n=1 Tax=Reichenbachiella sp. 5M10 TaxID=1889772 RepID=UPI000C156F96|nr:hypothetical protein [Reichenbachiella sp. 5M10]PIB36259.1 hypothetical protein BFP72_13095 [Reichenbachiella sp. 5M10]
MMTLIRKYAVMAALSLLIFSCSEDDGDLDLEGSAKEYANIRLVVSDATTNTVSIISPATAEVQNLDATHATSSVYPSGSGRYAALVHRAQNLVEFIDTGLELHGNHVDIHHAEAAFGSLTATGLSPTHFKSRYNQLLLFNDGDGTLSSASEGDINEETDMKTLSFDGIAHHGAMTIFSNGSYSVTVKDNTVEGTLPERVKVIDIDGHTLYASEVQTQGIHGSATNGDVALYGSVDGILVVASSGEQHLIDYPTDFGEVWIGSLSETFSDNLFIGSASGLGLYLINIANESITELVENSEIMKYALSLDETQLAVLTYEGSLQIYDLTTQTLVEEKSGLIPANDKPTGHGATLPNLALTEGYIYITQPATGEILQFSTSSLSHTASYTVSSTPQSMALLGYEMN